MGAIPVAVTVVVVGAFLWLFLSPGPTSYERATLLSEVGGATHWLALMTPGSSVTVWHNQTRRSFSFLKPKDTGTVHQTILFVFAETEWSSKVFEAVCDLLRDATFVSSYEVQGELLNRKLTCALTGQPVTIEFLTDELLAKITPALGCDNEDRFTLRVDGHRNNTIWRRVNVRHFQQMATEDPSWIMRRFARYQLRKHDAEKRGRP